MSWATTSFRNPHLMNIPVWLQVERLVSEWGGGTAFARSENLVWWSVQEHTSRQCYRGGLNRLWFEERSRLFIKGREIKSIRAILHRITECFSHLSLFFVLGQTRLCIPACYCLWCKSIAPQSCRLLPETLWVAFLAQVVEFSNVFNVKALTVLSCA